MNEGKIVVSVCMITYNHEEFVREAIEGVLMQEVDFPVELVIADDASPDRTSQVVQDYINNHPRGHWIKYFRHAENKGMMHNFVWALERCNGKYVALCEGDDFWIDSNKLQKQVDFLEDNSDFSIVSHFAKKVNKIKDQNSITGNLEKDIFDINYPKFRFYALPTASLVFRNIRIYPDWIYDVYGGDRAIIFICCNLGKLKIMDFIGSVYRIHSGGIEQYYDKNPEKKYYRNINEYLVYVNLSNIQFKKVLYKMIVLNYLNIFKLDIKTRNYKKSITSVLNVLKYLFFSFK
jgi:glycosyltransferase involved in cell wall biosynthesis